MKRLIALALTAFLIAPSVAEAQRVDSMLSEIAANQLGFGDRIAAVVNDNVVSTSDIRERMKLALLSSGLPATPEVERHLVPQILHGLVDEQLQLQEAKRLGMGVSKEEIDKAMERIAAQNNIPGDFRDYLTSHGASPASIEQQIRAGIAWTKVIQRELRPLVEVGDDEVDSVIARLRANAGKEEFLVSEILLTADSPRDDDQVHQAAGNLVQQIKGGASFGAVARQFSQSTGAASGGDIGWIQAGQLPSELNGALMAMHPGEIAGPIHTSSGYHILLLREKRTIALGDGGEANDISVDLEQAFRSFDGKATSQAVVAEASRLRGEAAGCATLSSLIAKKYPYWKVSKLGAVKQDKVPAWLADKVRNTDAEHAGAPIPTDKGVLLVFVCSRHIPETKVDRQAITDSIGTEKLELQARRLMRDLRQAAYIDLRLGNGS